MTGLMLAAALLGQASSSGAVPPETSASLRAEYTALVAKFAGRARPEPVEVVPPLCDLHRRLTAAEGVSHAERRRLLSGVERRLVETRDRMLRDRRRTDSSLGGGPAAAARELIALIESTVAPESWASAGGRGTIVFWSRSPALVVRQTGEVHHRLGGTLGGLRNAR